MHSQIKALRLALQEITAAVDTIERAMAHTCPMRFADCISPDVPCGYDTVLGYLAKHHPDVLETFDYADPASTQRDGFWLMHQTRGCRPVHVVAPMVLQRHGITSVRAWPVSLLAKRWE